MLSAIELYNKPDFKYREDAFAILAVNAWELLLKSQLFKCHKYSFKSICKTEPLKTKTGTNHKKKLKYHKTIMCPFLRTIFLAG